MHGPDSGDRNLNDIFEELFSERLEPVQYDLHPPDEALKSYLSGKLPKGWRSPDLYLEDATSSQGVTAWYQNEMTAHLITCIRCRHRVELLRESLSQPDGVGAWLEHVLSNLQDHLRSVPGPALVTMAVQFAAIVGLGAWILLQPASLTSASNLGSATNLSSLQMPTLPEPGPVVNPDELRSASTWSPQDKINMAHKLQSYTDPRYIAPLGALLAHENNPLVQRELVGALGAQLNAAKDEIASVVEDFVRLENKLQQQGDYPTATDEFKRSFNELFSRLGELQNIGVSQSEVFCTLTGSLALSQIKEAVKEANAKLIFDGTSPAESFRLQLPAMNSGQALQQLESQLSLSCDNN